MFPLSSQRPFHLPVIGSRKTWPHPLTQPTAGLLLTPVSTYLLRLSFLRKAVVEANVSILYTTTAYDLLVKYETLLILTTEKRTLLALFVITAM